MSTNGYSHEILCLAVLIWYKLTSARGYPSSSTKESSIPTPCCKELTKMFYVNFIYIHVCCGLALCCMYAKLNNWKTYVFQNVVISFYLLFNVIFLFNEIFHVFHCYFRLSTTIFLCHPHGCVTSDRSVPATSQSFAQARKWSWQLKGNRERACSQFTEKLWRNVIILGKLVLTK